MDTFLLQKFLQHLRNIAGSIVREKTGPMQDLAREQRLGLWEHLGFWMGMDTYREYSALNEMWDNDEAEWKIW